VYFLNIRGSRTEVSAVVSSEATGRRTRSGSDRHDATEEATAGLAQVKRPVSAVLAGPYGHPWHPLLVTVPIGAWIASLVFDLGSFVVPGADFLVQGSLWLIALGVVGALVAALTGGLDLLTIPRRTAAARVAMAHMALNLVVVALYVVGFLWRRDAGTAAGTVGVGPLALSVVAVALLALSGFLGGKLAFRFGVRVADESTQLTGYRTTGTR
jgi:uncharacterized membrane protein